MMDNSSDNLDKPVNAHAKLHECPLKLPSL